MGDDMVSAPMNPPFATWEDLEARWHPLTSEERERATTLIDDACDQIMTECPQWVTASPVTLKRICCQMVRRAMGAPDSMGGDLTSLNQTVGGITLGMQYSNPTGDVYLTKAEKRALGEGRQTLSFLDADIPAYGGVT